jgi:hypothetical protein
MVLINQSPSLTEPDSVYADFSHSYLAAVFLLVSTTVYPHRRPGLRARKIQEAPP